MLVSLVPTLITYIAPLVLAAVAGTAVAEAAGTAGAETARTAPAAAVHSSPEDILALVFVGQLQVHVLAPARQAGTLCPGGTGRCGTRHRGMA